MKKYENLVKQTLTALCLLLSSSLAAQDANYSAAELTTAASAWLQQQLGGNDSLKIDISALDNRIGDKQCAQPLSFGLSQPLSQRQNTVQIRCDDSNSWQLYMPVRIDEIVQAVVLQQNIAAGSLITADMLITEQRERRFLRGALVSDAKAVLGARSKRSLSMGQILTLQDLCLVCKGDIVTISVSDNGLNVSATGVAQADGSLGDTISVQNQQSRRTINAQVIAVNLVKVNF